MTSSRLERISQSHMSRVCASSLFGLVARDTTTEWKQCRFDIFSLQRLRSRRYDVCVWCIICVARVKNPESETYLHPWRCSCACVYSAGIGGERAYMYRGCESQQTQECCVRTVVSVHHDTRTDSRVSNNRPNHSWNATRSTDWTIPPVLTWHQSVRDVTIYVDNSNLTEIFSKLFLHSQQKQKQTQLKKKLKLLSRVKKWAKINNTNCALQKKNRQVRMS